MADENFLASIDIGSSKIVIFLAEEKNGKLEIFGHARGSSAGINKGEIIDIEEVAAAIKRVKKKAILSCDTKFDNVSVNISDPNLTVINASPNIHISGKVKQSDVNTVVQTAQSKIPPNQQLISKVTQCCTLDKDPVTNQGIIVKQPIGEKAQNLEISMHIVTASNQCVEEIDNSLKQSELGLFNIVPNSMASSEPYLTKDEKDKGVCLVDIGSGVTDFSVFNKEGILYSSSVPSGAGQATRDIMDAFNTSFEEAERLKIEYGWVQAKAITEDKLISFKQIDDSNYYYLSYESLTEVIEDFYLELFSLIRTKLKQQNLYRSLNAGFVLVGGGAKIKGCDILMRGCFKKKAKIGRVNTDLIGVNISVVSSNDDLLAPEYACALGLLLFKPDKFDSEQQLSNAKGIFGKIKRQRARFSI
ncbi:Cell division protein FtsA [Bathymodiolus heckerae thiotrophic gill symbiont]|uniref:cell division protein FtsA n=1 Tax=Bathymodiolus heckerae thiotrophic gill symbiont TaxID=1052212 RepID=UPI0010B5A528|nr:cell division protein FtsA [Bathymodiolus heckerae thiotrophic gill symbiont]SMN13196.1 Cell division protein FtsA [Bathymodiolus heckerae thiotrophic gill symbiont]